MSDHEDDSPNTPRGRRAEDKLVGWRLGQLEHSVTKLEEDVMRLRDDMITRTSVTQHTTQSRDLALRVGVWVIAVGQLATTILLLVTR